MMSESIFSVGDTVMYTADNLKYNVEHVTTTAGTPNQRFYVIRLIGRYKWLWSLNSPAITHTLPEDYAKRMLTIIK